MAKTNYPKLNVRWTDNVWLSVMKVV